MTHRIYLLRGRIPALAVLLALAYAVMQPASALAGGSSSAPAAIHFTVTIQAMGLGNSFNGSADGVANQNGDSQVTLTYGGHTYSLISAAGVAYQNEDGGAYHPVNGAPSSVAGRLPGGASPGPASCAVAQTGLGALFQQALSGQGAGAALGLQDLGPASVGGQPAEHLQGTVDLGNAVQNPALLQALTPLLTQCSGANAQVAAFLPLVLAGANMSIDAYVDPATGVPLQFNLSASVPIIGASLAVSGQMTPLSTPAAISAPS